MQLPSPAIGDSGWGVTENTARDLVDQAVAGAQTVGVTGVNVVLTSTQGAVDQSRNAHFIATGTLSTGVSILWPAGLKRVFSLKNSSAGSFALGAGVTNGSGLPAGTTVTVPQGFSMDLVSDGTNVSQRVTAITDGALTGSVTGVYVPGLLWGMTLANDGGAPNTVLDIAAGSAADSTNVILIKLASAFTKSTAGLWAAGTGANGMGNGLAITLSTWYHVFAIINAGAADVYFDTSVTAANKPASTTVFRRIGSFLTDASARIIAFTQVYDTFTWSTFVPDINAAAPGSGEVDRTLASVPPGVVVEAIVNIGINTNNNTIEAAYVYPKSSANQAPAAPVGDAAWNSSGVGAGLGVGGQIRVMTNTSQTVKSQMQNGGVGSSLQITTRGWRDFLGR